MLIISLHKRMLEAAFPTFRVNCAACRTPGLSVASLIAYLLPLKDITAKQRRHLQ
jgi:hypothetical protein